MNDRAYSAIHDRTVPAPARENGSERQLAVRRTSVVRKVLPRFGKTFGNVQTACYPACSQSDRTSLRKNRTTGYCRTSKKDQTTEEDPEKHPEKDQKRNRPLCSLLVSP